MHERAQLSQLEIHLALVKVLGGITNKKHLNEAKITLSYNFILA